MKKITLYLSILFCLSFGGFALAESNEAEDPERWYEVEIIVYKTTGSSGLLSESWKTDTPIVQPENLVDFLQPFQEIPLEHTTEQTMEQTGSPLTNVIATGSNVTATRSDKISAGATSINPSTQLNNKTSSEQAQSTSEQAFVLLPDELLQLKNEAKSLSRHPDYRLLVHYGWRQPVFKSSDSKFIRIAGGLDFSKDYLLDGSKIEPDIELEAPDDFTLSDINSNIDGSNANGSGVNVSSINTKVEQSNAMEGSVQTLDADAQQFPNKIALPWVPELDGNIRIYVNRYLHVKTDLFLRRPDRDEIEIIEIDTSAEDSLETPIAADLLANEQPLKSAATQAGASLDQPLNLETANQSTVEQTQKSKRLKKAQFSWKINDDFLESETQKLYVERLFNYELQQSRRLRSGELHLFDHPMLGVLIVIRPYDLNQFDSSVSSQLP